MSNRKKSATSCNISLGGEILNQERSLKYLGSLVNGDARYDETIKARIGIFRTTFEDLKKNIGKPDYKVRNRDRRTRTCVWEVLLFEYDVWTVSRKVRRRLEAVEIWFCVRMLIISGNLANG